MAVKQDIVITAGNSTPIGEPVHVVVTDPAMLAAVVGDGDLQFWRNGVQLDSVIASRSAGSIDALVEIPISVVGDSYAVEARAVAQGLAAPAITSWGDSSASGATIDTSRSIGKDAAGTDAVSTSEWVHPNVYTVPAGSWMRYASEADRIADNETVTHVRIDTPYPGADDDYENPHLLYSTDEGATWSLWSGITGPISDFPGGTLYHSDPCAVIDTATGDLICFWRLFNGSTSATEMRRCVVTGDSLEAVTVGAETEATITGDDTGSWVSPSVVVDPDGNLSLFLHAMDDSTSVRAQGLHRLTSSDKGQSWTLQGPLWRGGGSPPRGYWHGSVSGPFTDSDGVAWYYYFGSETNQESAPHLTSGALGRVRRSADLASWSVSKVSTIAPGTGVAASSVYQGCVYQLTDGTFAVLYSGLDGSGDYRVSRETISVASATVTADQMFGHGIADAGIANTRGPLLVYDATVSAAIVDRSTGVKRLTTAGEFVHDELGLSFDGSTNEVASAATTAGLTGLFARIIFEIPEAIASGMQLFVGDIGDDDYGFRINSRNNLPQDMEAAIQTNAGASVIQYTSTIAGDGQTHELVLTRDHYGTNDRALFYIDGVYVGQAAMAASETIDDVSGTICFGGAPDSVFSGVLQYGAINVQRVEVYSAANRSYGTRINRVAYSPVTATATDVAGAIEDYGPLKLTAYTPPLTTQETRDALETTSTGGKAAVSTQLEAATPAEVAEYLSLEAPAQATESTSYLGQILSVVELTAGKMPTSGTVATSADVTATPAIITLPIHSQHRIPFSNRSAGWYKSTKPIRIAVGESPTVAVCPKGRSDMNFTGTAAPASDTADVVELGSVAGTTYGISTRTGTPAFSIAPDASASVGDTCVVSLIATADGQSTRWDFEVEVVAEAFP